jgi:hypothetical protein
MTYATKVPDHTPELLSERNRIILKRRLAGETLQEIAEDYGLTRERVRQIVNNLNPTANKEVKERRSKINAELRYYCPDCGKEVKYGGRTPGTRCMDCSLAQPPYWTPDRIVDAMIEFRRLTGRWPSASDWNPALARTAALDHEERTQRYYNHDWPSTTTVNTRFGRWSLAVETAENVLRERLSARVAA